MIHSIDETHNSGDTPLIKVYTQLHEVSVADPAVNADCHGALETAINHPLVAEFIEVVSRSDVYDPSLADHLSTIGAIDGISPLRRLRTALNMSLEYFTAQLALAIRPLNQARSQGWQALSDQIAATEYKRVRLLDYLIKGPLAERYTELSSRLEKEDPHAVYPTSCYREGSGHVVSSDDDQKVEAVMHSQTFTSIRVTEKVLSPENSTLRDIYKPLDRCVAVVDTNVEENFGEEISAYFAAHGIKMEKLVYRAMEVDKGIQTVERMLGDFKHLGVSRAEPVLIAGGGVLSDTGGLACALYHRNTPYVMLSTSIVSGIDAGPSPRTCCDGFGYKNLFGAYHTPILSITDRCFFKTLKPGWIRHGIAEIVKMAVVKDIELFEDLERAGPKLIETRFGNDACEEDDPIIALSQKIIGGAIRSYVEAEYGNLYETHQCRPHAYGHTWSPGFEIQAGLLHGHAVAVGMALGAFMSLEQNWITEAEMQRIHRLIHSFGLSLWHDILLDKEVLWAAQVKMTEKRGGNLAAPLPKGQIGACGYLNVMEREELFATVDRFKAVCETYPEGGRGIEPHCEDVGLENPNTVAESTLAGANS